MFPYSFFVHICKALHINTSLIHILFSLLCLSVNTSTPSYLSDLLAVHIPAGPTRRSSTRPLLTVPHVASNFARRFFCFVSPTVWNSLPSDVQSSPSRATFKSTLKTHLFNVAFNDQPELWCCVASSAPQDLWNWHLTRYKLDYY